MLLNSSNPFKSELLFILESPIPNTKAKTNADKADQMLCDANVELLQAKKHLSDVLSNLEF